MEQQLQMNKKPLKLKKPLRGILHLFFRNIIHYLKISIIVYLKVSEGILCLEKKMIKVDLISYLCNIHTLVSFGFFSMIGYFFLRIKKKLKHENLIHVLPLIINNLTYFNET